MKRLFWSTTLASGLLILAGLVGSQALAGKDYFANPGEPHGMVTGSSDLPAKELWAVNISSVNDKRTTRPEGVWLKPGTYTIKAQASGVATAHDQQRAQDINRHRTVDMRRTSKVGRYIPTRKRESYAIELDVEEGKTYYIALDTSSHNQDEWDLVVWQVQEH